MDPTLRSDGLYFLKRNALFGALGDDVLDELAALLKSTKLDALQPILRHGDIGEGLYILRSGRARIVATPQGGEDKTLAYLGRGDTLGEMALLTGEPFGYTVLCDTPCEFLLLPKIEFDKVLERHPLVAIHLSRALTKRLAVSFHPPVEKPLTPQLLAWLPALPHEAAVLVIINLALALVEQTRRRVILVDLSVRSGDLAQALNLPRPPATLQVLRDDDLLDPDHLKRHIGFHPSGLEVLSLPPRLIKNELLDDLPPLLNLLKDHYDFTVLLPPLEDSPIAGIVLPEVDKALLFCWDLFADLEGPVMDKFRAAVGKRGIPLITARLEDPAALGQAPADCRVPWDESLHLAYRETGRPFLSGEVARPAGLALERIARRLGRLRVGLALGSGAAYGYAIIGLLRVFERENIPVDLIAGTSMGALLGSFYASGMSVARIEEVARTITKRWLYQNILGDLTFPHSGFLAGHTLHAFLRGVLGLVEFSQMPIPFAAVATDIRTGQEVVIREGRVADAVRASTSLPIVFRPFLYKGMYLVDGGIVNPVPTSTVASLGADLIVSMNLTAKPSLRRFGRQSPLFPLAPRAPGLSEILAKMFYTMQYEIVQSRREIAHVTLSPDMREFNWTDFHRSDEILKVGEASAEAALPRIRSLLPYFTDSCQVPLRQFPMAA